MASDSQNVDYLSDTQEDAQSGGRSQDLFDDVPQNTNEVVGLLKEILREQKEIKRKLEELKSKPQKPQLTIEGSAIERDYVAFLKDQFSQKPWITTEELKVSLIFQ